MPSKKQAYLYFRKENTMNEELFSKIIGDIFSKLEAKITIHWKDTVSDKPFAIQESYFVPEFQIVELDPLTKEELAQLASDQRNRKGE